MHILSVENTQALSNDISNPNTSTKQKPAIQLFRLTINKIVLRKGMHLLPPPA